jgi:hypothetical protein
MDYMIIPERRSNSYSNTWARETKNGIKDTFLFVQIEKHGGIFSFQIIGDIILPEYIRRIGF